MHANLMEQWHDTYTRTHTTTTIKIMKWIAKKKSESLCIPNRRICTTSIIKNDTKKKPGKENKQIYVTITISEHTLNTYGCRECFSYVAVFDIFFPAARWWRRGFCFIFGKFPEKRTKKEKKNVHCARTLIHYLCFTCMYIIPEI